MYLLLVRVFKGNESRFMMKASIFAWGELTYFVHLSTCILVAYECYSFVENEVDEVFETKVSCKI